MRRAYSLIELCAVLGVVAVLGILLAIKFDGISESTSDRATSQLLQTASQFIDDRHSSRGQWVVDPATLGEAVDGGVFVSGEAAVVGQVSVVLLTGDDGVALATPSPSGTCLTAVVTSDGWTDDGYVWGPDRPCYANEENLS